VPCYLSGLSGPDIEQRAEFARRHFARGVTAVKIFHDSGSTELLSQIDALHAALGSGTRIAVDALWRLELPADAPLLEELSRRDLYWLECPFVPDQFEPHRQLRRDFDIPLALGESYRTKQELEPFLREGLIRYAQPDLGRSGLTETLRIAASAADRGIEIVPHVSIAFGPQIAAAIHASAAIANCHICEYNPTVFDVSNRYLVEPLVQKEACYSVPETPGLGIDIRLAELLGDAISLQDVSTR
jgi:galactonate dehydratase